MRIFMQLCVDLKSDILFKDTLDFADGALAKLGITYDDMGIMAFNVGDAINRAILAKYPNIEKYATRDERQHDQMTISSGRTDASGNYSLRVDKSEDSILREIVKKAPRPFNFGAISVILDGVHWFPDSNIEPYLTTWRGRILEPNAYYTQAYMSNCLAIGKHYDYGKKKNPVRVTVEVGDERSGFNAHDEFAKPDPDVMVVIGSVNFAGHEDLYEALKATADPTNINAKADAQKFLIFDEEEHEGTTDHIVWIVWG